MIVNASPKEKSRGKLVHGSQFNHVSDTPLSKISKIVCHSALTEAQDVPDFHVAAGNPARIIRRIETAMDTTHKFVVNPSAQTLGAEKPMQEMALGLEQQEDSTTSSKDLPIQSAQTSEVARPKQEMALGLEQQGGSTTLSKDPPSPSAPASEADHPKREMALGLEQQEGSVAGDVPKQ